MNVPYLPPTPKHAPIAVTAISRKKDSDVIRAANLKEEDQDPCVFRTMGPAARSFLLVLFLAIPDAIRAYLYTRRLPIYRHHTMATAADDASADFVDSSFLGETKVRELPIKSLKVKIITAVCTTK